MCAAAEVTIPLIQKHLKETLDFLTPFLPMANSHMVTYLTDNLWKKNISLEIQQEIQSEADVRDAIDIFWNHLDADDNSDVTDDNDKFKYFRKFLSNSKQYHLDKFTDIWITPDELNKQLNKESINGVIVRGFMSPKKNHEVCSIFKRIKSFCSMNK